MEADKIHKAMAHLRAIEEINKDSIILQLRKDLIRVMETGGYVVYVRGDIISHPQLDTDCEQKVNAINMMIKIRTQEIITFFTK